MPRKSKLQKAIETIVHTFQPYTWIRYKSDSLWNDKLKKDQRYLFMGWITNNPDFGDNAVLMDDRGVFTTNINQNDFEVL